MAKNTTFTSEKAQEAAQSLRKFWQAGQDSLVRLARLQEKNPDAYQHGEKQKVLKAEAAKEGYNHDTMTKAWRVAQQYQEADIDELCTQIERHWARFGPTHLLRLLTVKDRRRRNALARKAIAGRWGVTQLETAILCLHQRRAEVGRAPTVPDDPVELRLALEGLCLKWCRWNNAARQTLPKKLKGLMDTATKAVTAVKKTVNSQLKMLTANKQQKA